MEKTFDAREVDFAGTHAPTKTGEVEPFFSIAPFAGKDFWQRMIYLLQHSLKGTSPYHSSSYKSLATALTFNINVRMSCSERICGGPPCGRARLGHVVRSTRHIERN